MDEFDDICSGKVKLKEGWNKEEVSYMLKDGIEANIYPVSF